jgi:hypothetical protein
MSDELRLPDRLAACEAELAAQPLAASTINRDELLYRAGWAAAEAAWVRRGGVAVTPIAAPRRTIVKWSMASGAAAAVLATVVTWSVASSTRPEAFAAGGVGRPTSVDTSVVAEIRAATRDAGAEHDSLVRRDSSTLMLWLVARTGRLAPLEQRGLAAANITASATAGDRSATARQLLNEYLPVRDTYGAGSGFPGQGILDLLHPQAWKGDAI